MATFLEALGQVARQTYCFALGNFDNGARALGRIAPGAAAISRVSGAVKAQLCSESPDPIPAPEPEFEGGQCPGVTYQVNYSGQVFFGDCSSIPTSGNINAIGPIGGSFYDNSGSAVPGTPPGCSTAPGTAFRINTGDGPVTIFGAGGGVSGSITGVSPVGGGANNCGDPPPVFPPPGDIIIEGDDITYEGDDNISITVPTSFIFSPVYVDLDGSLNVPVTIDVGGVEFSGTLEIAPEFNLDLRPGGIETGPGIVDDPTVPDEVDDPTPPPDDEPDELPIIGVLVFSNLDDRNRATQLSSTGGPDILAPRIASVQFAIKTGNSIAWTSDQDVKSKEAYIPCIPPQGAVAVRVTFLDGAVGRFTAVRGRPLTAA